MLVTLPVCTMHSFFDVEIKNMPNTSHVHVCVCMCVWGGGEGCGKGILCTCSHLLNEAVHAAAI